MRWVSAFLVLLLIAGTYLAVRFVRESPRSPLITGGGTPDLPPNVHLRLSGLTITGRKDGRPAWHLRADRMDSTRDSREIDFDGHIRADFSGEETRRATVEAASAHYSDTLKRLVASGGVRLRLRPTSPQFPEEIRIETDSIVWNVGDRNVLCPKPVRAFQGSRFARADGLTVDLKTRKLTLRNFTASLPVNEEGVLPNEPVERIAP
ncbi:MAG: LPS export ABC transporter periplasmic protein LptC [Capsulimonadales bacterium]|nr:LPS export ABC transporter periplasmic protein LptC [Capsulimonadales bacterium]